MSVIFLISKFTIESIVLFVRIDFLIMVHVILIVLIIFLVTQNVRPILGYQLSATRTIITHGSIVLTFHTIVITALRPRIIIIIHVFISIDSSSAIVVILQTTGNMTSPLHFIPDAIYTDGRLLNLNNLRKPFTAMYQKVVHFMKKRDINSGVLLRRVHMF